MIDWASLLEKWDWLGHIVEATVMAGILALIFRLLVERRIAILMGIAFAIGHFHGREKRDYENSVHMKPPQLDGYLMWRWTWDQATDFWPVAAVGLVAIFLFVRKARAKGQGKGRAR